MVLINYLKKEKDEEIGLNRIKNRGLISITGFVDPSSGSQGVSDDEKLKIEHLCL